MKAIAVFSYQSQSIISILDIRHFNIQYQRIEPGNYLEVDFEAAEALNTLLFLLLQ